MLIYISLEILMVKGNKTTTKPKNEKRKTRTFNFKRRTIIKNKPTP
jgi:hypothetical protein